MIIMAFGAENLNNLVSGPSGLEAMRVVACRISLLLTSVQSMSGSSPQSSLATPGISTEPNTSSQNYTL